MRRGASAVGQDGFLDGRGWEQGAIPDRRVAEIRVGAHPASYGSSSSSPVWSTRASRRGPRLQPFHFARSGRVSGPSLKLFPPPAPKPLSPRRRAQRVIGGRHPKIMRATGYPAAHEDHSAYCWRWEQFCQLCQVLLSFLHHLGRNVAGLQHGEIPEVRYAGQGD